MVVILGEKTYFRYFYDAFYVLAHHLLITKTVKQKIYQRDMPSFPDSITTGKSGAKLLAKCRGSKELLSEYDS